jgi:hypothetical protein
VRLFIALKKERCKYMYIYFEDWMAEEIAKEKLTIGIVKIK